MKILYPLLIAMAVFVAACTKDNSPSGPRNIEGKLELYTDDGVLLSNNAGAKVVLAGDNFKDSTTTLPDGKYVFSHVPDGNYMLVFSKESFGTVKRFGISHSSVDSIAFPQTITPLKMSMLAATSVLYFAVQPAGDGNGCAVSMVINPSASSGQPRTVTLFIGVDSTVSCTNAPMGFWTLPVNRPNAGFGMFESTFIKLGFKSGQRVYMKVYGDSNVRTEYIENDQFIYPCINPNTQPVASFILP